jgi:hypothetical protein
LEASSCGNLTLRLGKLGIIYVAAGLIKKLCLVQLQWPPDGLHPSIHQQDVIKTDIYIQKETFKLKCKGQIKEA